MCECGHMLHTFGMHLTCYLDIMYAFIRKNEHAIWKERWYTLTLGVSLQDDFYMAKED